MTVDSISVETASNENAAPIINDDVVLEQDRSDFLQDFLRSVDIDGNQVLDADELSLFYEDAILENGEIPTADEQKKMVLVAIDYYYCNF